MLGWKAAHAFLRPSGSPQYWLVGRQVSVTRRQPAMLWKESLWILGHLPDLVTTFLLADVAHMQQNNLISTEWHFGQWKIFFGLPLGPLIKVSCMSIRGNTWTDTLHVAHFSCLCLSLYRLEVGWSLCPFVLFSWPIACVYA